MSTGKMTLAEIFSEELTARLKSLRGTRNKAEFAAFLGMKPPTYFRYENGRLPSPEIIEQIADRCGVTVDWLLGRDDAEPERLHGAAATSALGRQDREKREAFAAIDDAEARGFVDLAARIAPLIAAGRSVNAGAEILRDQLDALVAYGRAIAGGREG